MKVIIIGCTHAGTAAAKTIKKTSPQTDIVVYERNDNISFLSCGLALYVGGVVKDSRGLFYSNPEELIHMGINTKLQHDVLKIDFEKKEVLVCNLETKQEFKDNYDKLVIAAGSWPVVPPIEGIHSKNVLLSKNFNQAKEIISYSQKVNKITVVGAGYIGVELAEAFALRKKEVVLIDAETRIMPKYLDEEFTDVAQKELTDHGVKLALGQRIVGFETKDGLVTKVKTDKDTFETEMVIMCIGFKPNTKLFNQALKTLPNGALIVNEYMQTSNPDVYACGDCVNVYSNPKKITQYIPLATNAVRMGTLVGLNLMKNQVKYLGTQGTSGIKIIDLNISSTGLTETVAKELGKNYDTVTIKDANRPEFMPDFETVTLKLVFDKDSRKILGGQIVSRMDLTEKINTLSVCIQNEMTVEQLAFVDFFFQPHFNKPWSLLNLAGLKALEKKI
ncbi:Putative NADH oxidase H2O2-forming [Candidatus Phytoplasma australiense]|uniref:NADH oxidase n=2 Tax=Phytoplasma australiense TaxID=59748 RepID=R4S2I2_PHYAS|nr:FAD-dependent oxidoreductase [Candidatus Phytoplasma australiense]AGL91029.1 NADH oxidase [Strawberry lethal yellows phytoplasma (CPA) str. NZSb11]CAM12171.1 Putative NADH oxidase H2O2-forming [Candidatus Phytoplasma australiense]